jgi:hypothetical protein
VDTPLTIYYPGLLPFLALGAMQNKDGLDFVNSVPSCHACIGICSAPFNAGPTFWLKVVVGAKPELPPDLPEFANEVYFA